MTGAGGRAEPVHRHPFRAEGGREADVTESKGAGIQSLMLALLVVSGPGLAITVKEGAEVGGVAAESACVPEKEVPCRYDDSRGGNVYFVGKTAFWRTVDGRREVDVATAAGETEARLAAAGPRRTIVGIVLGKETRSTSSMFRAGGFQDFGSVSRQFTLSLRNPKSGEEIKAVDLGSYRPEKMAFSEVGDYVWLWGKDLQFDRWEARLYNCRSGKKEYVKETRKSPPAFVAGGFNLNGRGHSLVAEPEGRERRHLSGNPYSIAEFKTSAVQPLVVKASKSWKVALLSFEGGSGETKELLLATATVKLRAAGVSLVERERIREILQEARFQNLGVTGPEGAAELGKLANATHLAFGSLRMAGTTTSFGLRIVGVESGEVVAAAQLDCRDCSPDDYAEAIGFLIQDWVVP